MASVVSGSSKSPRLPLTVGEQVVLADLLALGSSSYSPQIAKERWKKWIVGLPSCQQLFVHKQLEIIERLGLISVFLNHFFPRHVESDLKDLLQDPSLEYAKNEALFDEANALQLIKTSSDFGKCVLLCILRRKVDRLCLRKDELMSNMNPIEFSALVEQLEQLMRIVMAAVPEGEELELVKDDTGVPLRFAVLADNLSRGCAYVNTLDMMVCPRDDYKKYAEWKEGAKPVEVPPYGFLRDYFRSPGFIEVIKRIQGSTHFDPLELSKRNCFSARSLIPGSHVDHLNKWHWPSRLIEYFETFKACTRRLIEQVLTRYGLEFEEVPKDLQDVCAEFAKHFSDMSPSVIVEDAGAIQIAYEIPLRQHAAQVRFSWKSGEPITMNVSLMGGDEGDRWRRAAVIASLTAHFKGFSFSGGKAPDINYKYPHEISFTWDLPALGDSLVLLMEKVRVLIYSNTMIADSAEDRTGRSGPERFEELVIRGGVRRGYKGSEVEQFGGFFQMTSLNDWALVPGLVFQHSFYLNLYLIDVFTERQNIDTVLRIAEYSLRGLEQYGLEDYTGESITPESEQYFSRYAKSRTSSLQKGIQASLEFLLVNADAAQSRKLQQVLNKLKL